MVRQISASFHVASKGFKPTRAELKAISHRDKVKDFDRAVRSRKRAFGRDSVGDPKDTPDPRHQIKTMKQGRVLGGSEKEVDKTELTKALARDSAAVELARRAFKGQKVKPAGGK